MNTVEIAKVCTNLNREFSNSMDLHSSPTWDNLSDEKRTSILKHVEFVILNITLSHIDYHEHWCAEKFNAGWVYGPRKDKVRLHHPCLVDYHELSEENRTKEAIFHSLVRVLADV